MAFRGEARTHTQPLWHIIVSIAAAAIWILELVARHQ